jgi:GH15 family glucan-1,4-alpha-glucosidase
LHRARDRSAVIDNDSATGRQPSLIGGARLNRPIADYALIGDRRSAALVARDGAIDWLCWPRFDSDACFAALLGDERHGRWRIAPCEPPQRLGRGYRGDTLILETRHRTRTGAVCVTDLMPLGTTHRAVIRRVTGESGVVAMAFDLALRFDYGSIAPWLRCTPRKVAAIVGPDLAILRSPVDVALRDDRIQFDFAVGAGDELTFLLQYGRSHRPEPPAIDCDRAIAVTEAYWRDWVGRFGAATDWPVAVRRSLITLQALTHEETSGMVAAPSASLPEVPYGGANWDYRYTWLRDSTFAVCAFLNAGYPEEARAWRNWLLRAAVGAPERLQTMYRCDAARHIERREIAWLPGYRRAQPVHVGNAAVSQFQLDIYGEVIDSLYLCEQAGLRDRPLDIVIEQSIVAYVEQVWERADQGIWESRGPARHHTYSKAMAWVAIDRLLKSAGANNAFDDARRRDLERLRDRIHRRVCKEGFSTTRNSFVVAFGSDQLDASLLLLPVVGFLPIHDPRIIGTIAAIEKELVEDGLVRRWPVSDAAPEGMFLPCTFWLADCLGMQGRTGAARAYFERVLGLANDVGLLSEEWNPSTRRMTGNFPQALTHIALINTALGLCGPVLQRGG